jgi:nucleotide-binding universal stress UspA family protein
MPQHVLAATDFSPAAKAAANRAAHVAHAHSFELTLVHVFNEFAWSNVQRVLTETPLRPPAEVAARDLRALADELASRYQVSQIHAQVEVGRAAAEIIAVAQTMRPQLIVLGAQGEGLAKELGLGGTVAKVLRASPAPVLVVRREPIRPYERVVVGTDFSECSERALVQARELFPEASHTLAHAYWVMFEERPRLAKCSSGVFLRRSSIVQSVMCCWSLRR